SLAGVDDLNVFSELAEIRALAPAIPARLILDSATRAGAAALGFGRDFGAIEPGKRSRLLAVAVPPPAGAVEQYLLSGIQPEQLRWMVYRLAVMFLRLASYLRFVRFSPSVFALPFALAGALLASRRVPVTWPVLGWILVAMVGARSAAMGFNRLVDAD